MSEPISPPGQEGQTRAIVFDRERRGGRSSNRWFLDLPPRLRRL